MCPNLVSCCQCCCWSQPCCVPVLLLLLLPVLLLVPALVPAPAPAHPAAAAAAAPQEPIDLKGTWRDEGQTVCSHLEALKTKSMLYQLRPVQTDYFSTLIPSSGFQIDGPSIQGVVTAVNSAGRSTSSTPRLVDTGILGSMEEVPAVHKRLT